MAQTPLLRLLAHDEDDLGVISAALQDAVGRVGDIQYEPKARRLTLAFNRFRWETGSRQRVRSALQLGGVLGVQTRKVERARPEGVIELLALTFETHEAPAGLVTFRFAGGGDLRAHVECVDAVMADLSEPWPTPHRPAHEG